MLISVVTPALNSERYIRETLESIWTTPGAEPGETVEHIIVDGGSTDQTLSIASEYPSRILTGQDSGMYDAINKGLAAATGDVFGYVNSDDEVTREWLDVVSTSLARSSSSRWMVGPTIIIDGAGEEQATLRPPRWLTAARFGALGWNCLPQPSTFFRTDFARELGGFDTTFKLAGDYDLFMKAMMVERPRYAFVPLTRFRLHDANLAKNHDAMAAEARRVASRVQMPPIRRLALRWLTKLQINATNPRWLLGKRKGTVNY